MKRVYTATLAGVLVLAGFTATAFGQAFFIGSRESLAQTDFVDWGVLGPEYTNVANPFQLLSNGGLTVDVSKVEGTIFQSALQGGSSWPGNFATGDRLLYTHDIVQRSNPVTLTFGGAGVTAGGAQIQSAIFGDFTARIEAFDAGMNSLGAFTANGTSNGNADNSALFMGIGSGTAIHAIALELVVSPAGYIGDFAINQFDFTSAPAAVPEPTTLALFGLGLAGAGVARWRKRKA